MNLALFGDPYYVRMILNNVCHVYKNCRVVYVPEFLITDGDYNNYCDVVSIKNTVDTLYSIDEVLSFYRENSMPFYIKNFLKEITKKIPVRNINTKNILKSFPQNNYSSILLKNRPSILSLSMGQASQQYHIEMLINKYLKKMNFNFFQCFSPESRYILKNQNFNGSCSNIYEKYRSNYDLFVGGLAVDGINELINERSTVCGLIKKMSPDAVVINCSATKSYIDNNIHQAVEIFKYKYNIRQVLVVISEYYFNESLDVSIKIPAQEILADNSFFYISNFNKTTEKEFINRLLSTVYLPDGIFPV